MVWIMIQLATGKYSHHSSTLLKDTRIFLFDLSPHGAWFQPITFVSRSCTYFERKYHSFIGETACIL